MQKSKYLVANENDQRWGLTISTVGYEEIAPGEPYPTKGHADGYYFEQEQGRTLSEYQLLYVMEGEGVFSSSHTKPTKVREGDLFLLFPGEWHTYHPNPHTGWKSFWIGFSGRNMDDRVAAGFMRREKPIYHVGFSSEIVRLYRSAYDAAVKEQAHTQQLLAGIVNHLIGIMYALERNIVLGKNASHVNMINKARLRIREAQLVQDRLHLGEILQTEGGDERRGDARNDLVIVQQEGVHLVLLTVDNLGVLRAYYCAATAEDTPFLDDLCLMVLDFNRLYRTLSQAFITILATGFLKLEVLFHKSGLCCHITFQEQEVPVWDTPR